MIPVAQDLEEQHQGMSTTIPEQISGMHIKSDITDLMVTSDAFTRREQASEAKYIRDKEMERYDHATSIHLPNTTREYSAETYRLIPHPSLASRS